jgi:phage-related minor tail protein
MGQIEDLQDQVAALEATLGSSTGMVAAFEGELARMQETLLFTSKEVSTLSNGIGGGLRRAFDGLVFDGMKLSDALRTVAQSMISTVYNVAMRPVQNAFGGLFANGINTLFGGAMPFAQGASFSQGKVMPFAKGGVVTAPTNFALRGATGLMGEAGPEAVMPLTRGPDGRLGVQAAGGARAMTVIMNIQTPDVQSFQRSQSQIAAQASRALSRGQRNL